ncbi:MAX dimerization protein MGA a [Xyrauchen texanus]|uniref:MAX dimerization protein MGA a n=1 Tax=Xyrauchen texanus TaxID=154827 RepID=UPI002241F42D|nr:MAX dimerization protein MGA a [Xyrauchen texanus]
MANTEKQSAMVPHEEGMTAPKLAPPTTSAPSLFVVLKQLHPGEGTKDKSSLLTINEANKVVKSTISSAVMGIHATSSTSLVDTNNTTQAENLPADTRCKGITVTLDNNSMWNEFYRCQTEMILTKQGRRMFPCCRFRLSGMEPFQSYLLAMDIVPVDNHRYKWSGKGWETNGKCDLHVSRLFVHPESPATGLHWMQYPVSFYRLKVCNNTLDQDGHIILHSMHRYLPRLHVIPADKTTEDIQIDRPDVITLSFSQTEFFAVTAYQNLRITQLKIDYNPFAKGFREDAVNARSSKSKNGISKEEPETGLRLSRETTTLNNLKTLFMKRNAAVKVNKDQNVPSPTNGEIKVVNGDAPIVDRDVKSLCTKKRPLPGTFSDFIKHAHVKIKRLSLENIQQNSGILHTATSCTGGIKEVMEISSKSDNLLQVASKEETVIGDGHRCKSPDTPSNIELIKTDENKPVNNERKNNEFTLLSSDQKAPKLGENGKEESLSSLSTEAKPEAKPKKTLPLPLLAQFLKQRKSKTRPATPKPEVLSVSLDSEKSSKPVLTTESSFDLMSSTPSDATQLDSQPVFTSLSQTVTLSTTEANEITSLSTPLLSSSSSTVVPTIPVETQILERFSPSPSANDPFHAPNTTSNSKPNSDPAPESSSDVFYDVDTISEQGIDNTLRSHSDVLSSHACNTLDDTHFPTIPEVNTDLITPESPSVTISYSVFEVPSLTNNEASPEVINNQEHTAKSQVVESESISDCLLDSAKVSCSELFTQEILTDVLSTHEESFTLPLDDPCSPAFSLPSPAPSSPDPFPPDLFCDRPVPPRKTLDSFPERLLDCTGHASSDLFQLSLFCDSPAPPRKALDSVPERLLDGPITSKDTLSPSLSDWSGHPRESQDLFSQSPCTDRPGPLNDLESVVNYNSSEITVSDPIVPDPIVSEPTKQYSHGRTFKKSKTKQKKIGKMKLCEDDEVAVGPVPVPMQPSLEDVEGQLFVSFMSKEALEVHLGDDANTEATQTTSENVDGEGKGYVEEKIEMLEKALLHDLKIMKHRQVIHPVLQEVGLKLNLLDVSLEIDLQYLGVRLPIPPPVLLPEESSESSQVRFVSRTGKTSDFTKIKGWRDKFAGSGALHEGESSIDVEQKNLSAFCSDMLDEYLASEGKLIDERAANLSQTVTMPVAYQLPTKSTSYVRTLDSVLKKQVPPSSSSSSKRSPRSNKGKPTSKPKEDKKSKRSLKSVTGKQNKITTNPVLGVDKPALSVKKQLQSKRSKNMMKSKSLSAERRIVQTAALVSSDKTSTVEGSSFTAASSSGGRSQGLPKTLVKLMDVEDGAVWEGKHRTFITEERAAIALATLVTAEGVTKGNPDAIRIIKRRAPPCLNVFCRLGCVCASLVHSRRHHHCGKPQCMLGCSCLRRKVIALKIPKKEEIASEESEPQVLSNENKNNWKKIKKRKTYVLTDPEAAPEPAKRVNTLWDNKSEDSDSEILFSPPPPRSPSPALLSQELQHDLESFFSPLKKKRVVERNLNMTKDLMETRSTCARVRPFLWRCEDKQKTVDQHHISQVSTQDIEEGELVPLNLSGPSKRLEIISECSWASTDSRNDVLRIVCEHMALDRLKHPFWIGKYYIQPISKTLEETEEGSVYIYKVNISQPKGEGSFKKREDDKVPQQEADLKKPVGKNEVKGLPFLSRCSPAGLLKAEKKPHDAPGQIMVNGKPYPQAKLELGQMGALHPANRLAAYITGRICPVSQSGSNIATTTKASTTLVPVTSVATVTNTLSSTTTSPVKPVVTKPPVGKVFTQFVVNHINSQNVPSNSTPHLQSSAPNIVIPSTLLMVDQEAGAPGVALPSPKAGLDTQVSEPLNTTGSTSFPTESKTQATAITILTKSPSLPLGGSSLTPTTVSSSGSATSGKKTVLITVMSQNSALANSSSQPPKPVTQIRSPQTPVQKMLLQVVKTADGKTLYRNANGQLVQLVPLSQIKAIKPNLLSQSPTTLICFPGPNADHHLNNSKAGSTTIVTSSSQTSQTQAKTTVTVPVSKSLSVTGKPVTLTASKSVSFSSLPSTLKVAPNFLGQSGTCTLRILPIPKIVKDTMTPISSPSFKQGGFTLLTSLTPQNQPSTKSETTISVNSIPTKGPISQVQASLDTNKQSEMVPDQQNSFNYSNMSEKIAENVTQPPSSDSTSQKPRQFSGGGFSPAHMEQAEAGKRSNPKMNEMEFNTTPHHKEEDNDSDETEITDDSDLYSEDDHDNGAYSLSDSNKAETTEDRDSEIKDFVEVEVDIETIEESAEKNNISYLRAFAKRRKQHQCHRKQVLDTKKQKKLMVHMEKERHRRVSIGECFLNLQATLKKPSKNFKASKSSILTLAQEEIESLNKQEDQLVKKREKLSIKRERYIQTLSLLSDKSAESISHKLNEIITKQKTLEAQDKAKEIKSKFKQTISKPTPKPKVNDLSSKRKVLTVKNKVKPTHSPTNPMDLSVKKQKSLEKSESLIGALKPTYFDGNKNTAKTHKDIVSKPTQPTINSTPPKKPAPAPKQHSVIPRERTRPNILSRSSSQTIPVSPVKESTVTNVCIPQVIPLMNTMVPCNQIITINNPLQPLGITSVGGQQSLTPGVASVSISVPAISHPIRLENPLPMLQPQFFKFTNTQVESPNIPKISNVISLVPPGENVLMPQQGVTEKENTTPVVQAQPISIPAPVEYQQKLTDEQIPILEEREIVDGPQHQDVPEPPVGGDELNTSITSSNRNELEGEDKEDSNDTEDENLMSLLDELVLLSQQLSDDPAEPLNENSRIVVPGEVASRTDNEDQRIMIPGEIGSCTDKQVDLDKDDDDRALSPLFLTLDEDLMSPDNSKDDIDIPPKVDDLVKVIFGSESPSASSESGILTSTNIENPQSPPVPSCNVKSDAPTPPPLLHMKAACGAASSHTANEGANVAWRPMPKLVPLGLKSQDPVLNKAICSSVLNPDSE